MKITKLLSFLFLTAFCNALFTSCDKKEEITPTSVINTGLYVLNQGNYKSNNASLTYFDFTTRLPYDIFNAKNNRDLGDTGQDMLQYGSKIYIAMYQSSIIEIINAKTAVSIKTIPMLNELNMPSLPRSLTCCNGKVYITLYDGHVARLDTITLIIDKTIAVGSNPEGSVIANNNLYVANSGGMNIQKDSTISVINLNTFTQERKINVVINPVILKADKYGDLYVISMGNYSKITYTFQYINGVSEKVTSVPEVKAFNLAIDEDKAYIYYYDWATGTKKFSIYDVKNKKVLNLDFLPADAIAKTPYSIDVDPVTKDIFIGETDYTNTGKMYCFSKAGILKYTFNTGLNPVKTIFISNN